MTENETALIETLQNLTPALRNRRRRGWIIAGLVLAATIGLTLAAVRVFGTNKPTLTLFPAIFGVLGIASLNKWVIQGQQRLIMPHLAKTVGLEYHQDAKAFLNRLPKRLLPRAKVRRAEDHISGIIADRDFNLAEVKIETGGKNSRTLFRGIVVRFQNATPLPAFFMAAKRQTGGWFSWIRVDDLVEVDTIRGAAGETYGVWLSEKGAAQRNPALTDVLDILTNLEQQIGSKARLFSATSSGEEMHIALTHKHDLFRIGGLLANQDKITDSIKTAFEELNIPLRVVSALLEAERRAERISRSEPA